MNDEINNDTTATTATLTTNQPYMQNNVEYLYGWTMFDIAPAILTWGGDNTIQLATIDTATNQIKEVIFSTSPQRISKFLSSAGQLVLTINGKKYRIRFVDVVPNMLFGVVGALAASSAHEKSGILWWADNLKAQGVGGDSVSIRKIVIMSAVLMTAGLISLFTVLIVVGMLSSA